MLYVILVIIMIVIFRCGVAYEASFDRDFLNKYKNIGKNNSFAFDGTIIDYPYHFTKNITFIKKI